MSVLVWIGVGSVAVVALLCTHTRVMRSRHLLVLWAQRRPRNGAVNVKRQFHSHVRAVMRRLLVFSRAETLKPAAGGKGASSCFSVEPVTALQVAENSESDDE